MTTDRHDDQARDISDILSDLQRTLQQSTYYYEFGFPLTNIPRPGRAITPIDLSNTVWPLLEGTRALLSALSVALHTNDIDGQQGSAALELLEGHLDTAMQLLKRWRETPQTPAGVEGETSP